MGAKIQIVRSKTAVGVGYPMSGPQGCKANGKSLHTFVWESNSNARPHGRSGTKHRKTFTDLVSLRQI